MEDLLYLYSGGTGISLDHVSDIDMGEDTASDVIVEEDWATLFAPAQSIECDGGTGGSWKPDTFTRPLQAISDLAQRTSSIMSSAPHGRQAKGPILGTFNSEEGSLALKHPILSSSTASVSFQMIIVRTSLAKVTGQWFHYSCVGLSERAVQSIRTYICDSCTELGTGEAIFGPRYTTASLYKLAPP